MQSVQNAAARLITHSKKYDHYTGSLLKKDFFKTYFKSRKFDLMKLHCIYLILLKFMYQTEQILDPLNPIF